MKVIEMIKFPLYTIKDIEQLYNILENYIGYEIHLLRKDIDPVTYQPTLTWMLLSRIDNGETQCVHIRLPMELALDAKQKFVLTNNKIEVKECVQ